jgi:hypothetical protein
VVPPAAAAAAALVSALGSYVADKYLTAWMMLLQSNLQQQQQWL